MKNQPSSFQLIWGLALVLAGIGVFYKIPQKIPEILAVYAQLAAVKYFVYFCFYLIGGMLVGGGIMKIYSNYRYFIDNK